MFHRVAIQTQKKHRVQTKMFHRGYKMIRRRCLLLPRHKNILVQTQTKMTRRICVSQRTKMLHHVLRHRCVILSRPRCLFHLVQSAAASALRVSRLPSPTSSPPPATLHQVGVQTHKPTSSRPLCHTTPMAPLPNTTPKTATPGPAERGCAYIWRRPRQERSLGRGRVGNGLAAGNHLATVCLVAAHGRGLANMLVVATTEGVLYRVHTHTTHNGPLVPLGLYSTAHTRPKLQSAPKQTGSTE
jgi:hypothetical protein